MRMATFSNGTERNFEINAMSSCLQVCLQPCSPLGNILQTAEKLPLYNLEVNFISVMFVIKASMLICCMIVIRYFTFAELHF